ncbi:MAG: hypothetical protein Q9M10_07195, partial [Mariprofundaceae bacterium]|nr:hypothetical protein [Mariprofundaceae bacterium]
LTEQLNTQVRRFLDNQGKGMRIHQGKLKVSSIFQWFADDFKAVGGVMSFLQTYSSIKPHRIDGYLDYDWSLNSD